MILYTLMSFLGNSATYPQINGNILPDIYRFFCEGVSSCPSASVRSKKRLGGVPSVLFLTLPKDKNPE